MNRLNDGDAVSVRALIAMPGVADGQVIHTWWDLELATLVEAGRFEMLPAAGDARSLPALDDARVLPAPVLELPGVAVPGAAVPGVAGHDGAAVSPRRRAR